MCFLISYREGVHVFNDWTCTELNADIDRSITMIGCRADRYTVSPLVFVKDKGAKFYKFDGSSVVYGFRHHFLIDRLEACDLSWLRTDVQSFLSFIPIRYQLQRNLWSRLSYPVFFANSIHFKPIVLKNIFECCPTPLLASTKRKQDKNFEKCEISDSLTFFGSKCASMFFF